MVELLQHTSNLKKVQDKETRFLLVDLFLLKKIKILRALTLLTIYSYILVMPMIQHFL